MVAIGQLLEPTTSRLCGFAHQPALCSFAHQPALGTDAGQSSRQASKCRASWRYPAIVGPLGTSGVQRGEGRRGPVALRPRLSPVCLCRELVEPELSCGTVPVKPGLTDGRPP